MMECPSCGHEFLPGEDACGACHADLTAVTHSESRLGTLHRAIIDDPLSRLEAPAPILLRKTDTVGRAVALMKERRHGSVVVVAEDGSLAGIFTERDLVRGLGARQPLVAISFAIVLFSLTGLPPTAGFIGKLQLFAPVVNQGFWILAAIGLLNGAVSLYYYANPVREMFLTKVGEGEESRLRAEPADLALVVALAVPLVVLGLFGWDGITQVGLDAVARVP